MHQMTKMSFLVLGYDKKGNFVVSDVTKTTFFSAKNNFKKLAHNLQ